MKKLKQIKMHSIFISTFSPLSTLSLFSFFISLLFPSLSLCLFFSHTQFLSPLALSHSPFFSSLWLPFGLQLQPNFPMIKCLSKSNVVHQMSFQTARDKGVSFVPLSKPLRILNQSGFSITIIKVMQRSQYQTCLYFFKKMHRTILNMSNFVLKDENLSFIGSEVCKFLS